MCEGIVFDDPAGPYPSEDRFTRRALEGTCLPFCLLYLEQDSGDLPLREIGHSADLSSVYDPCREMPEQTSHRVYTCPPVRTREAARLVVSSSRMILS